LNPGVYGGEGMTNFWGRGILFRESMPIYGPSFAYQLGLISSPHGGFNITSSDKFPYFGFSTYPGLRPPNGTMQDNFTQKTSFDVKTNRPLWKGATLALNWKTDLGYNKNQTVITDGSGVPTFTNVIASESFNRTFLSLPSFFGINFFNNSIENVINIFLEKRSRITADADTSNDNKLIQEAASESFYDGLEAFSLTGGRVGKFLPAINWDLRWEGLEKFFLWEKYVKRMSFEHVYQSMYQEGAQITDIGKSVQNQMVQTGFNPLIGFNVTFDDKLFKGAFTASLRWSSMDNFSISSAARSTISGQSSNEISAQATYVLKGFDYKILGFRIKNDVEFSFLGKYAKNKRSSFDMLDPDSYQGGQGRTVDGNTSITIEPRIRYNVDNKLTTSFFVRYEGQFTEGAAQPGFHTTQVGLDLKISLSGGR
jgi:cell surface protein SprA